MDFDSEKIFQLKFADAVMKPTKKGEHFQLIKMSLIYRTLKYMNILS